MTSSTDLRFADPATKLQALLDMLELSQDGPVSEHAKAVLQRAITHSSHTYENKLESTDNYERLEFLGDAVLKLVVSEYLLEVFPYYREGELTKIRSVVVSDAMLALFARQLGLGDYMIFGPNEAKQGGANKQSSLACCFEALLGALFFTGYFQKARDILIPFLDDEVPQIDLDPTKQNYKATLQEYTQGEGLGLPEYETVQEHGPSHRRVFTVEVSVAGRAIGNGSGKSKKEAQQAAAEDALANLFPDDDEADDPA